jgi:hypothetical protein
MQKNKSKTKLKSKYAQDSKKLNVDSVKRQQKSSAAQNKSRSIRFYVDRSKVNLSKFLVHLSRSIDLFCRNRILQKTDRIEFKHQKPQNSLQIEINLLMDRIYNMY